jgi:CheY-like chemotaxis protein
MLIQNASAPRSDTKLARSQRRRVGTPATPQSSPLVATTGKPTRILIMDDVDSTVPLEFLLHGLGYWKTRVAPSGASGLKMAQDFRPSIVLLSLDLPDMSGYQAAQNLRERTEVRGLRLIALTGDYTHPNRDLAREAGFERYLAKPVSVSSLQRLLRAKLP